LRNLSSSAQLSRFFTRLMPVSKLCISTSLGKYRDRISATRKPLAKSLQRAPRGVSRRAEGRLWV